jgi:LacI family transcriptional regulator
MNIRQLASALNLSPGTISRSLRHHPDIPSVTRDMVIRAAAELGYTPRPWTPRRAVERVAKPSGLRSIGVLVGDGYGLRPTSVVTSYLAHYFLAGIHAAAQSADLTTSTAFVEKSELNKLENSANYPALLRGGWLDGVILIYPFPTPVIAQLAARWPCVMIERHDTHGLIDSVGHAQLPSLCETVSHLYGLGHRRIGFVGDIHADGHRLALHERFAGYQIGLDRFNLEYDPTAVIGVHGPKITDEQLPGEVAARSRRGITAWVCALDRQAYLLMRDLPRYGLQVPGAVSIVGFSGIDPLFGQEQLTTWRVPYDRIGQAAVEAVLSRARNTEEPVVSKEFPCQFVDGTTAAPPAAIER